MILLCPGPHCGSCHEDDEEGYAELWSCYPPTKSGTGECDGLLSPRSRLSTFPCCTATGLASRDNWAKLAWAERKRVREG